MAFNALFVLNSILFGVGLAMDAFSVSIANGLHEPEISMRRSLVIAGTFAVFQTVMPLLGWFCIHSIEEAFQAFQPFIPWIALGLLVYIGVKMILEGIRPKEEGEASLKGGALFIQGIATSIDALSVGFTMAELQVPEAIAEAMIIGVVTMGVCLAGIFIGRKAGDRLSDKATILGGIILIAIGVEIFLSHML